MLFLKGVVEENGKSSLHIRAPSSFPTLFVIEGLIPNL